LNSEIPGYCHGILAAPSPVMRVINIANPNNAFFEESMSSYDYAILSHTWGNEEVTYKDFIETPWAQVSRGPNTNFEADESEKSVSQKQGWKKIVNFAAWARNAGIKHIWIDTCKSSIMTIRGFSMEI
jgi:hypothetical protein